MTHLLTPNVGHYRLWLVGLSMVVCILACYVAIELVARIHTAKRAVRWIWKGVCALCLGSGLWAMNFIGLLALEMPEPVGYDPLLMLQGWLVIVFSSLVAMMAATGSRLRWYGWLAGTLVMTVCADVMIERGVAAMTLDPPPSISATTWLAASAIGTLVAFFGLWVAFNLRDRSQLQSLPARIAAAVALGLSMSAMHYLLIANTSFQMDGVSLLPPPINTQLLALLVGASTCSLLLMSSMASLLDRRLDRHTARFIESLQDANRMLEHSSRHDALTGLPNRHVAEERIAAAIGGCIEGNSRCALIYVDLDGFKLINDSLGHAVGDDFLVRASRLFSYTVGGTGIAARIGGDEFILLIDRLTTDADLDALCRRIMHSLTGIHARGARLTASIGVAVFPRDADNATALITAADMAMYSAKHEGRNRCARFEPQMSSATADAFLLQEELRHAIDHDELVIHYQPRYLTHNRALAGAEALVRWQHPRLGLLAPGAFVGVAERCGLINELEREVFELVCEQIRCWLDAGLDVPPISVNLSAARVFDHTLAVQITRQLERYALSANQLVVEITETMVMQEIDRARTVLEELTALGLRVALDDFGTGYSSLSYLRQLPIQQLKIDRSFIADLNSQDPAHEEIVRTIIHLAHVLRLDVVAEGIEEWYQFERLHAMGCDEVQGYLFNRPLTAAIFASQMIDRETGPQRSVALH